LFSIASLLPGVSLLPHLVILASSSRPPPPASTTRVPPSSHHLAHLTTCTTRPRHRPHPQGGLHHLRPGGIIANWSRRSHPASSAGPAVSHGRPSKAAGHGNSPTSNPQTLILRLPTSTAARARRRPTVGCSAHNLPVMEYSSEKSVLLSSFSHLLASFSSPLFSYCNGRGS